MLLLSRTGQMIVTTEAGQLVLLRGNVNQLEEQGRIDALSDNTWNHPIVVDGRLFIRNGCEAVCYEL